jgi:UDP-N-acetylglucosamine 2-epimerase (non-hydrolysing)
MHEVNKKVKVVFPIHPRTKKMVKEYNLEHLISNMTLITPEDYINLMSLAKNALKVVTDSGGLQKETYFLEKNALVLMEDTGWRELIDEGYNYLVDVTTDFKEIVFNYSEEILKKGIYGDGNSAINIVNIIKNWGDLI